MLYSYTIITMFGFGFGYKFKFGFDLTGLLYLDTNDQSMATQLH